MRRADREAKKTLALITPASSAADAMAEAESVRAALRVDVERWSMLTVAEELLRAGIRRFEREHQPELLKSASRIFATMTSGRWVGVRKPPHDRGLVVERDDGVELEPDALSTGTREQLYLAVRLAYVDTYGKRAEPLPVILDDVLVDFDPSRTVATLRALCDLTPQIILFTCHDHVIDLTRKNKLEIPTIDL